MNINWTAWQYYLLLEGVHLTLPPHIFSIQVKSGACYITGQQERIQNKINLNLTLSLPLPSTAFHNKICVFIMNFTTSSFLWLIHCLFFTQGGNVIQNICLIKTSIDETEQKGKRFRGLHTSNVVKNASFNNSIVYFNTPSTLQKWHTYFFKHFLQIIKKTIQNVFVNCCSRSSVARRKNANFF